MDYNEKISEKASEITDRLSDLGRQVVDQFDQSRQSAAGALDQTASSLHSGGDKVSDVVHSAADNVQSTADYIRKTGLRGMGKDILVTRNPGVSIATAAVFGFLLGRGLRRND
jgi:ElaB/YqjD/DUF883 family membrane-anchored ribosome-binding protein